MPSFRESAEAQAPPEEVWKLLYDPARFPDWWAGVATIDLGEGGSYTMFSDGYPDFPMAQMLDTQRDARRVTISCLVSDLRFDWRLEPLEGGEGTRITVDVDIPAAEATRLDGQRDAISASLGNLVALAGRA
jgi:uncharacterized protein YndB with AHSA1/START domain